MASMDLDHFSGTGEWNSRKMSLFRGILLLYSCIISELLFHFCFVWAHFKQIIHQRYGEIGFYQTVQILVQFFRLAIHWPDYCLNANLTVSADDFSVKLSFFVILVGYLPLFETENYYTLLHWEGHSWSSLGARLILSAKPENQCY